MAEYFVEAPITLFTADDRAVEAVLTGQLAAAAVPAGSAGFGDHYTARLTGPASTAAALRPGDVGRFAMPGPEVDAGGILHTPACDDLSAVAAALAGIITVMNKARG